MNDHRRTEHPNVEQVLTPDGIPQDVWVVRRGELPAEVFFDKQDALDLAINDSHWSRGGNPPD